MTSDMHEIRYIRVSILYKNAKGELVEGVDEYDANDGKLSIGQEWRKDMTWIEPPRAGQGLYDWGIYPPSPPSLSARYPHVKGTERIIKIYQESKK